MVNWISVREFAKYFSMTRQGVADRIKRGSIKAKRFGNVWMIQSEEQNAFTKMRFGTRKYLVRIK